MGKRRIMLDTRGLLECEPSISQQFWPAKRHGEPVLVGDWPWENWGVSCFGSVHHDGERYKMWYNPWPNVPPDEQTIYVAYAESSDGISWDKPDLGIVPFGEQPGTNLTDLYRSIPSVIHDPGDPDPDRRYKAGGWAGRSLADLAPDREIAIRFALEDADLFGYELIGDPR